MTDQFLKDVWNGLSANPKNLSSKYFYDEEGDKIFQEIMDCPEYYLTSCELEIFAKQTPQLTAACMRYLKEFDVVELGPGNAFKSSWLLKCLKSKGMDFTYYPIDISKNIIELLENDLPKIIPGIKVNGLNGDYFDMLKKVKNSSARNKLVLFLGSSIGNIPLEETISFFTALKNNLVPGDIVLIGFDLKKEPDVILNAYNDSAGITKRFNLNLLRRINEELGADFIIEEFDHKPVYIESEGACKSYLVSRSDQVVHIPGAGNIFFARGESIFMEIAQKYTVNQTDEFAINAGYKPLEHFYDSKKWFTDVLWRVL